MKIQTSVDAILIDNCLHIFTHVVTHKGYQILVSIPAYMTKQEWQYTSAWWCIIIVGIDSLIYIYRKLYNIHRWINWLNNWWWFTVYIIIFPHLLRALTSAFSCSSGEVAEISIWLVLAFLLLTALSPCCRCMVCTYVNGINMWYNALS